MGVSMSPDGRCITSIGRDGTVAIIDVHMAQAGPVHVLSGFRPLSTETTPCVSPDSRMVAICGAEFVTAWEIITGTRIDQLPIKAVDLCWANGPSATSIFNYQLISAHENGVVKWWSV